jgi:hypothetical protein
VTELLVVLAVVSALGGVLLLVCAVAVTPRGQRPPADDVPVGVDFRVCDTAECADRTLHAVLPCKAAVCLGCSHENPAPAADAAP